MSQHYYDTQTSSGRNVQVLMGWDRPLQQFFLVVEDMDQSDEEQDPHLYSNLDDAGSLGLTDLGYFLNKLKELGITIPERMVNEIQADCCMNMGNRQVGYNKNGTIICKV